MSLWILLSFRILTWRTFIIGITSLVPWMTCLVLFLLLRRPPVYSCHTHVTVCRHGASRAVPGWVYLVFSCWKKESGEQFVSTIPVFYNMCCGCRGPQKPTWSSSNFVALCAGMFGQSEAWILCSRSYCLSKVSIGEEGSVWWANSAGPPWRDIILLRGRTPSVDHGAGDRAVQVAHAGRGGLFQSS